MQRLGNEEDHLKKVDIFIKDICKQDPELFTDLDKAIAFKQWGENLVFEKEETPLEFKIDGRLFKSCYMQLTDRKIPDLLSMHLGYLIEAANLEFDLESYKNIDNIAALFYREDWSKRFDKIEYLNNALLFNKQALKYSLWGVEKYHELIVTLKTTYPILYEDNQDNGKSDGRKMFDVLNGVSGDSPIKQEEGINTKLSNVFQWLEQKKIDSVNEKLKNK